MGILGSLVIELNCPPLSFRASFRVTSSGIRQSKITKAHNRVCCIFNPLRGSTLPLTSKLSGIRQSKIIK